MSKCVFAFDAPFPLPLSHSIERSIFFLLFAREHENQILKAHRNIYTDVKQNAFIFVCSGWHSVCCCSSERSLWSGCFRNAAKTTPFNHYIIFRLPLLLPPFQLFFFLRLLVLKSHKESNCSLKCAWCSVFTSCCALQL